MARGLQATLGAEAGGYSAGLNRRAEDPTLPLPSVEGLVSTIPPHLPDAALVPAGDPRRRDSGARNTVDVDGLRFELDNATLDRLYAMRRRRELRY